MDFGTPMSVLWGGDVSGLTAMIASFTHRDITHTALPHYSITANIAVTTITHLFINCFY